jgi:quaternary ammonium compound-resistance protein SugE
MAWIMLVIAGVFEVVWAYFMKQSYGFTRLVPTILTFGFMFISFGLLSVSMKTLPLGTAYAMWTGIGAAGAFAVGIFVLGEAATPMRLLGGGLIIAGLAVLKLATPE